MNKFPTTIIMIVVGIFFGAAAEHSAIAGLCTNALMDQLGLTLAHLDGASWRNIGCSWVEAETEHWL